MSPNNAVPIDARREDFRKYLDKEGILESISKGNLLKGIGNKAIKGQLISKCLLGVIVSTKKTTNFFKEFLP